MEQPRPTIDYAGSRTEAPRRPRRGAVASVWIGGFCMFWSLLDTGFEPRTHDRIGMILAVIGGILAVAALRSAYPRKTLAIVGLSLCVLGFVANWLFPAFG